MKTLGILRHGMIGLATLGMLCPAFAGATPPPQHASANAAPRDVALHHGGRLIGQVLDSQGAAVVDATVDIGQNGNPIARTRTDASGRFEFAELRGGVYTVSTPESTAVFRLWAPNTAPPAASQTALLLSQQLTVRGRHGQGGIVSTLANPWVLGGLTAAAIAIPLALGDDDDQPSGS